MQAPDEPAIEAAAKAPIDVVYILGMPHSGTTLLSNLLGEFEGCVCVGELCLVWRRWLTGSGQCGCGQVLASCQFWDRVRVEGFRGGLDARWLADFAHRLNVTRRLPAVVKGAAGRGSGADDVRRYRAALAHLYRAIAEVADKPTIIDSTKSPGAAVMLENVPGIRVHLVHVVRDSRGTLFSHRWRGNPERPGPTNLLLWSVWHLFAELRWSRHRGYLRVRYEDFVAAPEDTLERILSHVGQAPSCSPVRGHDRAHLSTHHTVGGNPNRFTTGGIQVSQDVRWRRELSARDRALAIALTGPLLIRHRYLARDRP